jgi:hypothetical protein
MPRRTKDVAWRQAARRKDTVHRRICRFVHGHWRMVWRTHNADRVRHSHHVLPASAPHYADIGWADQRAYHYLLWIKLTCRRACICRQTQ